MKTLSIKEAQQLLLSGQWLHVRYITADVEKGKGGTVMELPKCRVLLRTENPTSTSSTSSGIQRKSKAQNHHENFTINVELPNRLKRKIQIVLITHINSIPVI